MSPDMNKHELLLVGCGNMGRAMLDSWLDTGFLRPETVHVVEPMEALRAEAAALGVKTYTAAARLPANLKPEFLVLAVKPQVMAAVLPGYRLHAAGAVTVSIAAGIPIRLIEDGLGEVAAVRVMPNTPAAIGKGSLVLFANGSASVAQIENVTRLFSANGAVHPVDDEGLIDAVTAISGSGPAYVFHFIECLAEAGVNLGLPAPLALALARETVEGAGALAVATGTPPSDLRRQVTSPGGTTEAALNVLMGGKSLREVVCKTVVAAHRRAVELGRNISV